MEQCKELMEIRDEKEKLKEVSDEQQSSVEISMNAKGEYTFKAKVYCDEPTLMSKKLAEYVKIAKDTISKEQ